MFIRRRESNTLKTQFDTLRDITALLSTLGSIEASFLRKTGALKHYYLGKCKHFLLVWRIRCVQAKRCRNAAPLTTRHPAMRIMQFFWVEAIRISHRRRLSITFGQSFPSSSRMSRRVSSSIRFSMKAPQWRWL